jgi:hypothetical protein
VLGRVDKLVIDINTSFLQKLLLDDIKQKYDLHSNKATRSFDGVIVILFFFPSRQTYKKLQRAPKISKLIT